MSKIKLTKGELKRQRDSLKQFQHYLPTLQLKKQQLQMKILEAQQLLHERTKQIRGREGAMEEWLGLFADPDITAEGLKINFKLWLTPQQILTEKVNIAGATIPIFQDANFAQVDYDLYLTPLWVDLVLA